MKNLVILFSAIFVSLSALANMDVLCECKGPVVYAGLGQVAGSGKNLDEAMQAATYMCAQQRGGQKVHTCRPSAPVNNPSVLCGCRTGVFNRGQVSGAGKNLGEAMAQALYACGQKGLGIGVLNGLNSCTIYSGN